MSLGDAGPRDWSPSEPPRARTRGSLFDDDGDLPHGTAPTPRRNGKLLSWLAFLAGICAIVLAFIQPKPLSPGLPQSGYIVSAVGVFAIMLGLSALKQRRAGFPALALLARVGMVFGSIATALMLYAVTAVLMLPTGFVLPALPSLAMPGASPQGAVLRGMPPEQQVQELAPSSSPSTDPTSAQVRGIARLAAAEQLELCSVLEVVEIALSEGGTWLGSEIGDITLAEDGVTLTTADGIALLEVPPGTKVSFGWGIADERWAITLIGAYHASLASYDSATGMSLSCSAALVR